jgi:hypothetical protein
VRARARARRGEGEGEGRPLRAKLRGVGVGAEGKGECIAGEGKVKGGDENEGVGVEDVGDVVGGWRQNDVSSTVFYCIASHKLS